MEEAKLKAQEHQKNYVEQLKEGNDYDEEYHKNKIDQMKPEVNNLLWSFIQDASLNMYQMELLAMLIYDILWNPKDYIPKDYNGKSAGALIRSTQPKEQLTPQSQVSDGWVSIEDKLPEQQKPVLVITDYGGMDVCRWTGELWINDMRSQHSNGSVTHWQPLPKQPK